jgi:hypothetical protein
MQRDGQTARAVLRRGEGYQLHHRLHYGSFLPSPRILVRLRALCKLQPGWLFFNHVQHPQRRSSHMSHPFETTAALAPRKRIQSHAREQPGGRHGHPIHPVHTPDRRAGRHPTIIASTRRQLPQSPRPRSAQIRQPRHHRRRNSLQCERAHAQHENRNRRHSTFILQRALVPFHHAAAGLVGVRWAFVYVDVYLLSVECGGERCDLYCVF